MPIIWEKFTGIETICKEYTDPPLKEGLSVNIVDGTIYVLVPATLRNMLLSKMGWTPDNLKVFIRRISAERIDDERARVIVEFEDDRRAK